MKAREIIKGILTSHLVWAIISFGLILLFTGLTQYDYDWNWKTNALIASCVMFILFGLGSVGFSIFNLFIYLFKKLIKKK